MLGSPPTGPIDQSALRLSLLIRILLTCLYLSLCTSCAAKSRLDPCQSAVRNAVADLGKTFGVQVDRVEIRETKAAGNAESTYSDRTKEALILLYAPSRRTRSALPSSNINTHDHISLKSKELMQRSDLMTSYSAFLVNKCPNLAKISFGLNYTGWIRSFSLVKGDYVRPDTCLWVSRDRTQISKWGESVCVD